MFVALGTQNHVLLGRLGLQHHRPFAALRLHLFVHGFLDVTGRLNVDDLHPFDPHTPFFRRLIQRHPDVGGDFFPAGQGFIQLHIADNLPHGGGGNVAHPVHIIGNSVCSLLRPRHLIEDDGVDFDLDIILGNDRLRRHIGLLDAQIVVGPHMVDNRNQDVDARRKQVVEFAQSFHNANLLLGNNFD
ncbi:hypothetical protein D3C75_459100 [compost metagenome]